MKNDLYPGVTHIRFGDPEPLTPVRLRLREPAEEALQSWACSVSSPLLVQKMRGRHAPRGYTVEIPLAEDEHLYGLGLQSGSFEQRGKKKTLRVNSDPTADLGDSHAPVPFYVSTAGYGILVDTARYATFYMGCLHDKSEPREGCESGSGEGCESGSGEGCESGSGEGCESGSGEGFVSGSKEAHQQSMAAKLYESRFETSPGTVTVEVPIAQGVDVYVFWGEDLREAVQRYNLFSGGGCLPPLWGLAPWYRVRSDFSQQEVLDMADALRADGMPFEVLGLEPGWQSHSYPCSFVWSEKFPDPAQMTRHLLEQHYRVNLWEHVFTHSASPVHAELFPLSGNYTAFNGIVPDLSLPQARRSLAQQHGAAHVDAGVSGYKLDECDNSDFIGRSWSFPECSRFPSGLDGEQMHSLLGVFYQSTIESIFRMRDQRTYGSVRSSQALAAPHPFVLYSDLYGHKEFIRALANSGFSGLLWTPEVRDADSAEDLIRRLQTVAFSPQALVNAWYIKNPPWKQWQTESNNNDHLADDWQEVEAICRDILRLRMRLLPYLYAAFGRYQAEGLPPFRALVMDYPNDVQTFGLDDQYLMGDFLLVAPMVAGQESRLVYLPEGRWHDFWTGAVLEGKQTLSVQSPLEQIPLFVKSGAVLPLAAPNAWTGSEEAHSLIVRVYGDGSLPITLVEDDGQTLAYERGAQNRVRLTWSSADQAITVSREGSYVPSRYVVTDWEIVAEAPAE
ncbi:MAG: TIM-barrel domain-containing protein [Janthinobacterium lividum]